MRKILLVIDMQNDFIDGALGTKEAEAIVNKVVDKIKSYNVKDVFATLDTHGENYLETQEGKKLPIPHCIYPTEGWELHPNIRKLIFPFKYFYKTTFGSTILAEKMLKLSEAEPIEIEIVGLCTDICVISNALLIKAVLPEVPITVDASCCAGVTPESHRAALETMKMCQINVINE